VAKLVEARLDRLNLLEAVVFALYGNWLITFISDKISFMKYPPNFNIFGIWYQEFCVAVAFACLLILFVYSIYRPHTISKKFLLILYTGHIVGIYAAFFAEGLTKPNIIFLLLGYALFLMTFILEIKRIRIARINRINQ
jgi:hypothetical protein